MPAHDISSYAEPAVLRDGVPVLIRAIAPGDKALLLDHFRHLGPISLRHRFFGGKKELSATELAYFTELDFVGHVGLAAILRWDGVEHMVGVGRYCCGSAVDGAAASAEVAFAVVDEHQGRGIGTLLLEHLAGIARNQGVTELVAMADNVEMMHVFTESGFVIRRSMNSGIYHVAFPPDATEAFVRANLARRASHATK